MSSLLISEPPLQVIPSLAEEVGLNEAIVLQQVHYWLQRSQHELPDDDGVVRQWVYKTLSEWEEEFPFWSRSTIQRTLRSLVDDGYLVAEKKRKDQGDTTVWYSVKYAALPDMSDCKPPSGQNEQGGMSDCTNGGGQNDQTRGAHYARAQTETTTTENTTENGSSSGRAPAREDAPSGDSLPTDAEVAVAYELPDEYDLYESEIDALREKYAPDTIDQLVRNQWGQDRNFSFHAVAELARENPWPYVVAGVVIAANEADQPNPRYLASTIDALINPTDHEQSPDADAKQRPADNHERISAAVDAAFDDGGRRST